MNYFIEDDEFGEIEVRSNGRIRRCKLSILSKRQIVLLIPVGKSVKEAESIINGSRAWIRKHIDFSLVSSEITYRSKICTYSFDTEFVEYDGEKYIGTLNREKKRLTIHCPKMDDLSLKKSQSIVKNIIENVMVVEAKRLFPTWISDIAKKHNLSYSDCKIRKMHSRWGSCSSSKSIHLSCMLLLLPKELIEFVMIHELCHTVEMNHSVRFHQLVDACLEGQEKELEKKIKKYSPKL